MFAIAAIVLYLENFFNEGEGGMVKDSRN